MTAEIFTPKQSRFIDEFLVDANGAAAAVRAGYAPGSAKVAASRMLSKDNPVRRAIQARQATDSERLGVSRERVISGLLEAVDMAREQSNAQNMITALRELGRLMGFYAPAKVEVDVRAEAEMAQFERMSDAELLTIVEAAG
jgi:phage terminase small subunit